MNKQELIQKWLKNELSATENQEFNNLEDAEFNTYIVDYAKHFKASHHSKVSDFESFKQRYNASKQSVKSLNWYAPLLKIASVVVIAFGIAYFTFLNDSETLVQTLASETTNITLPDNSFVKINGASQLAYSEEDWAKKRQLQLNGEAFFDVEKGEKFDVKTSQGIVSVLGTEFNVLSRDGIFTVACYEGLVQVNYNNKTVKLPAGTAFELNAGNAKTFDIAVSEPTWLKNMSVFDNATLAEVISELEKEYNVKVSYQLDNDNVINFTGAFEHNNLENALKSITQALNLTYMIQNKVVIISNAKN